MAATLALSIGILIATGCGERRGPSPSPPAASKESEYAAERGDDLSRVRALHAEGKSAEAAEALRALLASPDWQVRSRAVATVGELKEKALLPELHRALLDEALFVRERASRVLQTLGDATSVAPLRAALGKEKDSAVRGNIAEALAIVAGAAALPDLARLLGADPDEDVRARTASALGAARVPGSRDALVAALTDASPEVRARAAESLGSLADPAARAPLEKAAKEDREKSVRAAAAAALEKLRAAGTPGTRS